MRKTIVALLLLTGIAPADARLRAFTDIITWDKPLTEAQCVEKGQKAIAATVPGLSMITANHAAVGTKDAWILSVDCLQSYKLNGAYVVVMYTGEKVDEYTKAKEGLSRALGGKSEVYK